jgi:hypothetical protein
MQTVIPNTDLRGDYNVISKLRPKYVEPDFETDYEMLGAPSELCINSYEEFRAAIEVGFQDFEEGRFEPMREAMESIRKELELG